MVGFLLCVILSMSLCLCAWSGAAEAAPGPCDARGREQVDVYGCVREIEAPQVASELAIPQLAELRHGNWVRIDLLSDPGLHMLDLGIPDAFVVRAYLVQDGKVQPVLDLGPADGFAARPVQHRSLIAPLALRQGAASVFVYDDTHVKSPVFATLLTPARLTERDTEASLFNGLIFGVMLAIGLVLTLGFNAPRQLGYRLYGAVVLANTIFIAQVEGYFFAWVWPSAPAWNMLAPGVFALAMVLCHILFAIHFLQLKRGMPLLYRVYRVYFCILVVLLVLHVLFMLDALAVLFSLIYIGIGIVGAYRGAQQRISAARLYLAGAVLQIAFPTLLLGELVFSFNPFPQFPPPSLPKFGYLGEALMFGIAVIFQINQFNARHAEQRLLRLAETEQLLQAEQAKSAAMEKAVEQQMLLASASHDISQPLASLRFAVTALNSQRATGPLTEHIDHTLQYAQSLLDELIGQARQERHLPEQIALGSMLLELGRAYTQAASDKGLRLSVCDTSLRFAGSSMMLHRILANLLANAVRYTSKGRILLGARRREDGVDVMVIDTGPGIPPSLQKLLLESAQAYGGNEKLGLGLAIVNNLCRHCHYQLRIDSAAGRGTCFSVFIPLPRAA